MLSITYLGSSGFSQGGQREASYTWARAALLEWTESFEGATATVSLALFFLDLFVSISVLPAMYVCATHVCLVPIKVRRGY